MRTKGGDNFILTRWPASFYHRGVKSLGWYPFMGSWCIKCCYRTGGNYL